MGVRLGRRHTSDKLISYARWIVRKPSKHQFHLAYVEAISKFSVSSDLEVRSIPGKYVPFDETLLDFWYWEAFSFRSWTKGRRKKEGRRGKRVLWRMENARSISLVFFVASEMRNLQDFFHGIHSGDNGWFSKIHEDDFNIRPESLSMLFSPIMFSVLGRIAIIVNSIPPPIHRAISSKPFPGLAILEERKTGTLPRWS